MTNEWDVLRFFEDAPRALPLYEALEKQVLAAFDEVHIKVQKTQITFANRHNFACVWLPGGSGRKLRKDQPEVCLAVTFGLLYRLDSPRIEVATEPYPNRWTHHVLIQQPAEIDGELKSWLREAYDVSAAKR